MKREPYYIQVDKTDSYYGWVVCIPLPSAQRLRKVRNLKRAPAKVVRHIVMGIRAGDRVRAKQAAE